jgi:hypothetical protein
VALRLRLLLSAAVGVYAGLFAMINVSGPIPRDFTQVWLAARAILAGADPYAVVGPGLTYDWPYPLLYPLPAAILALPVAWLSAPAASAVFMILGASVFAFALMRHGLGPLLGAVSASAYFAFGVVQWSPVLAAAVVLPPLSVLLVAKPTIGAAVFVAKPSWWAVWGGLMLAAVAFAIDAAWFSHWLGAVDRNARQWAPAAPYRAPVTLPGGILALACLLRWRRPEARLVAALACVPQTLLLYEALPLFLVPRTWRESILLTIGSYGVLGWVAHANPANLAARHVATGSAMVLLLYLPATVMVLLRSNEGPLPSWLERWTASRPPRLRGRRMVES